MRALSGRQAARCEEAETPRCVCRCGGAYHGARRAPARGSSLQDIHEPDTDEVVAWLRELPADDPHHVRPKTRKLELQGAA
jgi:hypothetical protein